MTQKFSKVDVAYQAKSRYSNEKCQRCANMNHGAAICKILDNKDDHVEEGGWCQKFEDGKHIIIDLDQLEVDDVRRRLEWRIAEAKRKERLRKLEQLERTQKKSGK